MEFLPPDIAPLHDPDISDCTSDICLDPRRSAEDTCPISLSQMSVRNTLNALSFDIECALNNPDVYRMPNIEKRGVQIIKTTGNPIHRLHARTLIATAPLFELRGDQKTIPDSEMYTSYVALSGLASLILRKHMANNALRGAVAEVAVHAALLRGGRNVPFLTSRREEASHVSVLNNDLGAYDAATGRTGKVPLQIKRSSQGSKPYIENRILPVVAKKVFGAALEPYPQLTRPNEDAVDTVFRIMAQERQTKRGYYLSKSPSGKVLASVSDTLNETIDTRRQQFEDAAYAQGIRSLVSSVFADKPGIAMRANVQPSLFVQVADGGYIFFNTISVVRREHETDPDKHEYRVSFGYGADTIASISCTGSESSPELTTVAVNGRPEQLPKDLLRHTAAHSASISWENAR